MGWIAAIMGAIEVVRAVSPPVTELVMAVRRPSGELDVVGTLDIAEARTLNTLQAKRDFKERLKAEVDSDVEEGGTPA